MSNTIASRIVAGLVHVTLAIASLFGQPKPREW